MPKGQYALDDISPPEKGAGAYALADARPDETTAAGRFLSAAASTLNPMPILSQVADVVKDPVGQWFGVKPGLENVKNALHAQLDQAITAATEAKKVLDGEGPESSWRGKLMTASEALGHGAAALVPLVGPPAAQAGERIGAGDIAGGVGEGAGLIAGVVAPRVIPTVVGATTDAARSVVQAPMTKAVVRGLVKPGATALGASVGGPVGAVIGSSVGDAVLSAMKTAATAAPEAAGPAVADTSAVTADLASGRPMGAAEYLAKLKTLPPEQQAAVGPGSTARAQAEPVVRIGGRPVTPVTVEPAPASAPPLGVTPPVSNNVTPPPNPQPPPATTPANTPAAAAPSAAVKAALPIVRDWTVDEMQQVTKLPVDERQLYLKLRQVGDTHAEAIRTLDFQRESQALRDQASNARAMVGSSKAASDLFGTSTPDAVQKINELAPGPSRPPLAGLTAAMDARFKQLISDPKMAWLLPLLGGAGLGALAQRKDAN